MKLKLNGVRVAFPAVFKAEQFKGTGPFNYRVQLLVPEKSTMKKEIAAAILSVAQEKWGVKAPEILKAAVASKTGVCFVDGNSKTQEGFAGHWALSATRDQTKGRPLIIDADKTPLEAADGRIYSGVWVNASVELWAQNNDFGKTVRCGLLGIQFAKDDAAFAGGGVADVDDFDDLSEGAFADDLL